jgi:hypothetical protein
MNGCRAVPAGVPPGVMLGRKWYMTGRKVIIFFAAPTPVTLGMTIGSG